MGRTACTEPQCLYKGYLYLLHFTHHTLGSKLTLTGAWKVETRGTKCSEKRLMRSYYSFPLPPNLRLIDSMNER